MGEDIRQHRRTIRIAWSAAAALLLLAVGAAVSGWIAIQQRDKAEMRASIALLRQIAAEAVSLAGSERGDLALLLSLEALKVWPTVDARNGLLASLVRDPRCLFYLHGPDAKIVAETTMIGGGVALRRADTVAIATGERGGELHLWDAVCWDLFERLAGKAPVALSPDGRLLAAAVANGAVAVRDLERGRPLARVLEDPGNPETLAFMDGGRLLVAGGNDLRIWDVTTGRMERDPMDTGQGGVTALAAHPNGRQLASGGLDGSILIWNLDNPQAGPEPVLTGHTLRVATLDFSADGQYLVSGGFDDSLRFWEVTTGASLRPPIDVGEDVYVVTFGHSTVQVAAATESGSVLLWRDTAEGTIGTLVGTHLLQSDGMTGLSFGPDDRFLISSSLEQTQSWGLKPGQPAVRTPIEGSFAVLDPRGDIASLVTDSQEIRLVDVATWRSFSATLGRPGELVSAMAFSPDGRQLATAAEDELVVWDMDLDSWRKRACLIAGRNLSAEEQERYLRGLPYEPSCPDARQPPRIPLDAERALGLAVRAAKLGELTIARQLFDKAAELASTGQDARLANEICWFGSLHGAFAEVIKAGEQAVALDPTIPGTATAAGSPGPWQATLLEPLMTSAPMWPRSRMSLRRRDPEHDA